MIQSRSADLYLLCAVTALAAATCGSQSEKLAGPSDDRTDGSVAMRLVIPKALQQSVAVLSATWTPGDGTLDLDFKQLNIELFGLLQIGSAVGGAIRDRNLDEVVLVRVQ